ncbi:hypothetical protein H0H93_001548 [Arthromyces matolae]|nr:hypothetical protein H0H93_001548 [Arthromyces matolae]
MTSLRRLAQTNNAAAQTGSPRSVNDSPRPPSTPSQPSTPRNRVSIGSYRSPASTASISSSIPFDWDAARSRKPPPFGTPVQKKGRQSMGTGTPVKRVVRKQGIIERVTSLPSKIAFEIALFPENVPRPEPTTAGRLVGGLLHLIHFCVRVSQTRRVPDSDLGWEDMYNEDEGTSWFDWTTPVTILLLVAAVLNTIYLFTRLRVYRLHHRAEPVSSPNARFVSAQLDFEPLSVASMGSRVRSGMWFVFSYSWRWLAGLKLPTRMGMGGGGKMARVQQLEVWSPGRFETELFTVYSPVHAIGWMATSSTNWIAMILVMGMVWAQDNQLNGMVYWYTTLIKDKEIIAAEVMSEYNNGFVYPRVMPVRKDAAVMTHESEIVNGFDGDGRERRPGCFNPLSFFTNDLNARDSEFSQEVIYQIEEKLDELKEASDSTNSAEDLYNGVKNEIVDVGNDVAVLARELAKLMVKAEGQKKEMAQVKERITESRTNFQQLQSTFQCLKESRERDQKTIAALEAAVQMYTENPVATTAPAVPSLSLDQIVDLMEDPLVDIVRETARPLLEDLREQVQTMLNTQNEEMYKTLWGKLSLVLKMVETISKRMERIDQGGPSSSSNSYESLPNIANNLNFICLLSPQRARNAEALRTTCLKNTVEPAFASLAAFAKTKWWCQLRAMVSRMGGDAAIE